MTRFPIPVDGENLLTVCSTLYGKRTHVFHKNSAVRCKKAYESFFPFLLNFADGAKAGIKMEIHFKLSSPVFGFSVHSF